MFDSTHQSKPAKSYWRCVVVVFFFFQVSHKPKSISHAEAASIPYVASTALSSLVNAAGLCKDSSSNKRQVVVG